MYKEILKVALWCCWWRHRDQSDLVLHNLPYIFHHKIHYCDAIMGTVASQITSLTIVYTTVYSDADQSKHQSSASLAFVWGIHRRPVNSPHKWPVTRKMFPFDDVIMEAIMKVTLIFVFAENGYDFFLRLTIFRAETKNWVCRVSHRLW